MRTAVGMWQVGGLDLPRGGGLAPQAKCGKTDRVAKIMNEKLQYKAYVYFLVMSNNVTGRAGSTAPARCVKKA